MRSTIGNIYYHAHARISLAIKMERVWRCLLWVFILVCCSRGRQPCDNPKDCYPSGYREGGISISPSLVNCSSAGDCVCRECFVFNAAASSCALDAPCWRFCTGNGSCEDHRRSQRIAVILAALLSSVGAANFYVARYEYAVPQLALFLCLIIASCFGRVIRYLLDNKGKDTEKFCALCSTVSAAVVAILTLGTILAWWVADIVIFVRNARTDGENCPLKDDL